MPTAAAPPDTTRAHVLRVARDLIQTRSYLGFSFQDIADQVGIRKASLYHHFPSKEALGVEVLQESTAAFRAWSGALPGRPAQKVAAYCRMFRDALHAGRGVCPAGALAPGWDCIDEALREAVRGLRAAQVGWLEGVLREMGLGRQAGPAAAALFAACQGALLSARMTGRVEDFDQAIAFAREALSL
ncbi:TetR/AcrR family transcriptional regulator [Cupriavidus basilensis]|uniref:TetR/AcrR family transcriptional regulator n=1 Tax=Cupriavidus basilensis TaxID=68895 RepID=A0ABT6APQ7_9BURK|nr:TetR/AcrR family transcriptional regulator [Cupriavidus basilensis]MDF3834586.1 TetR/AcrR family transcriptional regulator [Cupriavidus basilensis]